MAVLRPRNRLVYFRLSEDEFERVNLACHETGARSISDLARHALQRMIDPPPGGPEQALMVTRLQVMDDMIRELNGKLEQLSQLLVALRSSEPGGPAADGSGK